MQLFYSFWWVFFLSSVIDSISAVGSLFIAIKWAREKKTPNVKEMLDFLDFILKYTHGRSAGWSVGPVSLEFSFAFHLFFKLLFWLSCESSPFFASAFTIHISAAFCVKSVQPPLVCRSRPVQHAVAYYERLLRFIFCKKFSKKKTLFLLHVVQSTDPVHKRGSKKKLYA